MVGRWSPHWSWRLLLLPLSFHEALSWQVLNYARTMTRKSAPSRGISRDLSIIVPTWSTGTHAVYPDKKYQAVATLLRRYRVPLHHRIRRGMTTLLKRQSDLSVRWLRALYACKDSDEMYNNSSQSTVIFYVLSPAAETTRVSTVSCLLFEL